MAFPGRAETEEQLVALVEGRSSPAQASDWARPYVTDEGTHPAEMDWPVWDALAKIFGADLLSGPDEYLHGASDYGDWLAEYRRAVRAGP